jgi:hypothetical protein
MIIPACVTFGKFVCSALRGARWVGRFILLTVDGLADGSMPK